MSMETECTRVPSEGARCFFHSSGRFLLAAEDETERAADAREEADTSIVTILSGTAPSCAKRFAHRAPQRSLGIYSTAVGSDDAAAIPKRTHRASSPDETSGAQSISCDRLPIVDTRVHTHSPSIRGCMRYTMRIGWIQSAHVALV